MTIIASGILFKEWNILTAKDIVGALCGFMTIICDVFLLHTFKDINVIDDQIDDHILCLASLFLSVNVTVLQYIYHLPIYLNATSMQCHR